ncbi:triple functional domain protein-like [Diadema antillarum]|uniref:triple functional domain protein-like n=1 Tax=Diadema antillarum TaxID=105358 RepID=UPI003A84AC40
MRRSFRRFMGKKELEGGTPGSLPINNNDLQGPKRKGSIKKWLTSPIRKPGTKGPDRIEAPNRTSSTGGSGRARRQDQKGQEPFIEETSQEGGEREELAGIDNVVHEASGENVDLKPTVRVTELPIDEEEGEAEAVPLPPPMELQNHSSLIGPPSSAAHDKREDTEKETENGGAESGTGKGEEDGVTMTTGAPATIQEENEDVQEEPDKGGVEEGAPEAEPQPPEPEPEPEEEETEEEKEEKKRQGALHKLSFVLQEMVATEADYVSDLAKVKEGYIKTMKEDTEILPPEMEEGKVKIVFGNISQIYEWHRDTFSQEIAKVLEEPEKLGPLFKRYERRLRMYVVYCQNKPKSEYLVNEFESFFEEMRVKLGHKLALPDLLIKPVQRIMKYQLLLKDILKQSQRAGMDTAELEKAVEIMKVVPKKANDMMAISRLQGWDGKINAQGELLCQDTLNVAVADEGAQKYKERRVFMFEQIIIFADPLEKKKGFSNPGYIFKHSVKVNQLVLDDEPDPLKFTLRAKAKDGLVLLCQATTPESKQNWLQEISKVVNQQQNLLKALQSPIAYQKGLEGASLGLDPFGCPEGKSPGPSPAPSPTSPGGNQSTKLRKAVSQSSEPQTQLQKQHTIFNSLKMHRKNQTAPAAISLNELKENKGNAKKKGAVDEAKSGTPTHDEKAEKGKDDKKDNQAGSPSIRRKFFDGLFHSFRPSKSRDTSPMGSKESLQKGREQKEQSAVAGKETLEKANNKSAPLSSHLDLVTGNNATAESTAESPKSNAANRSPLMRTQSAKLGTVVTASEKASPGSASTGNSGAITVDGKTKGSPLHVTMGSSSPSKDSGVSVRSKRASTGSLQKEAELNGKDCADSPSSKKGGEGSLSSPARSQLPHGVGNRDQAGSPFNRSSYASVSSSEPDDGAFTDHCMAPIVEDYTAVKEDEISVSKGEVVQILAANQHNMFLVYRAADNQSPAMEGWIPGQVMNFTGPSPPTQQQREPATPVAAPSSVESPSK